MQVGIHFGGIFYEFVPWNGVVSWEIAQWGHWFMAAENETHKVLTLKEMYVSDVLSCNLIL